MTIHILCNEKITLRGEAYRLRILDVINRMHCHAFVSRDTGWPGAIIYHQHQCWVLNIYLFLRSKGI